MLACLLIYSMFIGSEVFSFLAFLLMSCRCRSSRMFIVGVRQFRNLLPLPVTTYLFGLIWLTVNRRLAVSFPMRCLALSRPISDLSIIVGISAPGGSHSLRTSTSVSSRSLAIWRLASVRTVTEESWLIQLYTAHSSNITVD